MKKTRLEAFSDGVIAIIITIMVLEIKVPLGETFSELIPMVSLFLSYILSFVFIAIYWQNHHHTFQIIEKVDGRVLWANTRLLFCLSLLPFATGWMGENHFARDPVILFGFLCTMSGFSYLILINHLVSLHGKDSTLAKAIGKDYKGKVSMLLYMIAIVVAYFWHPYAALVCYVIVSIVWFLPDRRIEKLLSPKNKI